MTNFIWMYEYVCLELPKQWLKAQWLLINKQHGFWIITLYDNVSLYTNKQKSNTTANVNLYENITKNKNEKQRKERKNIKKFSFNLNRS